jgi:hypothetical protein
MRTPTAWPLPPPTRQCGSTTLSGDHGDVSQADVSHGEPVPAVVEPTAMLMSP